ncbi:MAG: hypothetical protein J5676_03130, partial [Bacteroidaceae bacterium]|nr:hypothetical protein [Bacteroidaceae bacterium]
VLLRLCKSFNELFLGSFVSDSLSVLLTASFPKASAKIRPFSEMQNFLRENFKIFKLFPDFWEFHIIYLNIKAGFFD